MCRVVHGIPLLSFDICRDFSVISCFLYLILEFVTSFFLFSFIKSPFRDLSITWNSSENQLFVNFLYFLFSISLFPAHILTCPSFCLLACFILLFFFYFFFFLFIATPEAYVSSQARGQIRVAVIGLHHSHRTHLQPMPKLAATLDP